jgi:hypothetical protein
MVKSSMLLVAAALLVVGCTPMRYPAAPAPVVSEQEVSAFLTGYLAAIGSRDATGIRAALVAGDRLTWIEDGKVSYRSADAVIAGLAAFPAGTALRTELVDLEVVPVGQSGAHAWAMFRTTVGEGAAAFSFGGAISFMLERDANSWKIVGGHTSSPRRR